MSLLRQSTLVPLLFLLAARAWAAPPARLPDVDSLFADVAGKKSPGCALGVYQRDQVRYARGYGMADLDAGTPIATGSVFEIASTSKQFTAATLVLLAAEGKLSLDDGVRKYVPRLPPVYDSVTIRHMLHHTSGARDYLDLAAAAGYGPFYTIEQALDLVGLQRSLNFATGTNYQYSNTGYFLMSQVVRAASGKTLRQYAKEKIFAPLGMSHTHFHDDNHEKVPDLAIGYRPDGAGFAKSLTDLEMVGDGGVNTTIEDLAAWSANFDHNILGGLGDGFTRAMETPATLSDGRRIAYALGLRVDKYRGLRVVGHSGAFVGYRSTLIRFPSERLAVAVLCNASHLAPWNRALRVAEIFLKDQMKPEPELKLMQLPAEALRARVGHYVGDWALDSSLWRIEVQGDSLVAIVGSASPRKLGALSPTHFVLLDEPRAHLRFRGDALDVEIEGGERGMLHRKPLLGTTSLDGLAGEYWSPELRKTWRVTVESGKLALVAGSESLPLAPFDAARFHGHAAGTGLVEAIFDRASGRASFVDISISALRGLRFQRR